MNKPIVSIVMGSDSDLPIMQKTAEVFDVFGISYEVHILSAHRTPEETRHCALHAVEKGIKIIIAGAGGAAHLPGVIASYVEIPVIGVPIQLPALGGIDSLYSIVQMPPGIPVATVGINASKNAGLLAVQMLGLHDKNLKKEIIRQRKMQMKEVLQKDATLQEIGIKKYVSEVLKKG